MRHQKIIILSFGHLIENNRISVLGCLSSSHTTKWLRTFPILAFIKLFFTKLRLESISNLLLINFKETDNIFIFLTNTENRFQTPKLYSYSTNKYKRWPFLLTVLMTNKQICTSLKELIFNFQRLIFINF